MKHVSHWTVPADHPAFAGHFPGTPILPGVVLLDAALQAIATNRGLALDRFEISSVKFLSPVSPGCILAIEHAITDSGTIRFDVSAESRKIASGSIAPILAK
jgi:3-hydroxyacyl-[acyl-carrier-protein] dehydratase